MEDEVLLSNNKSYHNISTYDYMKMMEKQAPSLNYTNDHLVSCIPTNKHSRLITKQKPRKIRIIHIMPPEIIQTDKANFRNLVQSLTGKSSSAQNTRIKKHRRPQASSGFQNTSYLLGFSGSSRSSYTNFNPNKLLMEDPNHEQLNLDAESDHDFLINGFQAKVEKDEMIVQADAIGTEWEMKDTLEKGFCIDGFLELDDWFPQETKFPNSMPHVGSNWGIDLFGEF